MFNSWLALAFQFAQLGLEAQSVIALWVRRLAAGGVSGLTEARVMVTDKMEALTEAHVAAASTILTGNSHEAPEKVLRVFKKRVRANRTRLSNQRSLRKRRGN